MRSRLLSQLAHDLRTPLNVIGGTLDELQKKPSALGPEEAESMLALARRSVTRIVGLTDRLSLASSMERGVTPILQPTELTTLVRGVVDRFAVADKRKRVELTTQYPEAPLRVNADPAMLTALLLELLSNANRHARKQVRVEVIGGDRAEVRIEDDGDGITEEELPTLYEPFVERKNRTGLGIGLWLAQSLAQLQQGRVTVTTGSLCAQPQGKPGVRVQVDLPLAP